ncbi:SDR family oxidoreductase [Desulfovibrio cuneatus]|uniref:SDR family oxidoreductase n=1 Tax=Desulfovibrio cuneatus TaxID=159728 RepID=UPI0003FB3DAD|nr:SDR family oxidoreductase [Desulfovibrio cuneatus]
MKTVFITGASSGIGKEAVKIFATKGWNVIAAMHNPENDMESCVFDNIIQVRCDVKEPESVKKAFAIALETFGEIDVLVNNAGIYNTKPLESMSEGEVADILDTNIKGVITCTQSVLPHFRKKMSGTIINISSIAGFTTFPFQTIYHASKWGLEGLSESLQYELKPLNIKVKIVEPGVVKTSLYDTLTGVNDTIHTDYVENFRASYKSLLKNIEKGFMPNVSARTIYQAATENTWRMRYRSGADTRLVAFLHSLLPLSMFTLLIEKLTGLRQTHRQNFNL